MAFGTAVMRIKDWIEHDEKSHKFPKVPKREFLQHRPKQFVDPGEQLRL